MMPSARPSLRDGLRQGPDGAVPPDSAPVLADTSLTSGEVHQRDLDSMAGAKSFAMTWFPFALG